MECIKRRLLHIAELTYFNPLAATGRFAGIGWVGTPRVIRREPDVALVGRIESGIVVAFRGTRAPLNPKDDDAWVTFLDWMNNANFLAVGAIAPYPGRVHEGFARSVNRLWSKTGSNPGIKEGIDALVAEGAPRRLYFTGHSKGGPLANLAAYRATLTWPDIRPRVVTFAGARPGDAGFKAAYDAAGIATTRYEVKSDIVPLLPLGGDAPPLLRAFLDHLPFANSNQLGYVGVGDQVAGGTSAAAALGSWVRGLFSGGNPFDGLKVPAVKSHLITPDSQYDLLVCPRGEPGCAHG